MGPKQVYSYQYTVIYKSDLLRVCRMGVRQVIQNSLIYHQWAAPLIDCIVKNSWYIQSDPKHVGKNAGVGQIEGAQQIRHKVRPRLSEQPGAH